jgi:hypothetical protein
LSASVFDTPVFSAVRWLYLSAVLGDFLPGDNIWSPSTGTEREVGVQR